MDEEGIDRRRLVRILIVLAIGVPILIEATTFFGLVSHSFGDDGGDAGTPTPMPDAVGVGDDLLADTDQEERITTASVGQGDGDWQFVFTVQVENAGEDPYELAIGTVQTTAGTAVEGAATTGRMQPGETTTVTGSWHLPEGERPRSVAVTATTYSSAGQNQTTETVRLEPVPVQRSA